MKNKEIIINGKIKIIRIIKQKEFKKFFSNTKQSNIEYELLNIQNLNYDNIPKYKQYILGYVLSSLKLISPSFKVEDMDLAELNNCITIIIKPPHKYKEGDKIKIKINLEIMESD